MSGIIQGVAIALGVSGVLWLVEHPEGGEGKLARVTTYVGDVGDRWAVALWAGTALCCALAGLVTLRGWWTNQRHGSGYGIGVSFPSWPSTLLMVAGLLGAAALGLGLCSRGNTWGLLLVVLAGWGAWRFVTGLRHRLEWYFGADLR